MEPQACVTRHTYRERVVLRRPLRLEEIQQFTDTARRIAAMSAVVTPKASWAAGEHRQQQRRSVESGVDLWAGTASNQ